jgi:mannosyl-oligosaccharide alpha-1,2-mannosidase
LREQPPTTVAMLRLRRYRVLLVCAFVITVLLYHVSKNSQWDHSKDIWREAHRKPHHDEGHEGDHHEVSRPQKPQKPQPKQQPPPPPPPPPVPQNKGDRPEQNQAPDVKLPQLKTADGDQGGYGLPKKAPVPDKKLPSNHDGYEYQKQNEDAGIQVADPVGKQQANAVPTSTAIYWKKPKEWFPVPKESLITLPTGKPKAIPSIQFDFAKETLDAKEKRESRLAKIKAETSRAWAGYKKYAWMHDELTPVTKKSKDPFCGWAATLVDSLDTLWIMGLKEEFDDAVEAVKDIDFTTTHRDEIPVFETIIRYLGGLVGAYDVTGNDAKYRVLLDKAVELAEILMGVFDTPNRLPILYYRWKPVYNVDPKRASTNAGVAELGSMSLEFTRLAQLTGEQKYYDAIARVTDAFEELQNREGATAIPGIFPEHLDASGCNRSAPLPSTNGARAPDGLPENWACAPQGLTAGGWRSGGGGSYSMGGSQDSTYEYFPKQYLMLGGLEPKYRTMHEKTADAVKEYLLFRPMAQGDPDILFSAKVTSTDGTAEKMSYEWETTHLTCFLGGTFGLGGKIFNRPEDVEIGKKLTDGCVWAYDVMPTGVMPEHGSLLPCKKPDDCHYDEAAWYAALDPTAAQREKEMEQYNVKLAEWKEEVKDLEKQHALQKKEAEADLNSPGSGSRDDTPGQKPLGELTLPKKPTKPVTHLEYVTSRIKSEHIPSGFVSIRDKRYILR